MPAAADPPDEIVVIGDSIAYGQFDPGVEPGRAWPEHVKFETLVQGHPIRVVNLSQGGASAFTWAQEPALSIYYNHPQLPDTYALIALGVNDAIGGRHWVDFGRDIATIALNAHEAGSEKVILVLMPTENGATPAQARLRRDYNVVQRLLCDSETVCRDGECVELLCIDLSWIPLQLIFPVDSSPAFYSDGSYLTHPTAIGQAWIGVLVRAELRSW